MPKEHTPGSRRLIVGSRDRFAVQIVRVRRDHEEDYEETDKD